MVSSAQFFTALAQVSAALVAFVIAISTVLYSVERQERARRTRRLRELLSEINNDFSHLLFSLLMGVRASSSDLREFPPFNGYPTDLVGNKADQPDSPAECLHDNLHLLTLSVTKMIDDPSVSEIDEILSTLSTTCERLRRYLMEDIDTDSELGSMHRSTFSRQVYAELADISENQLPDDFIYEKVLNDPNSKIRSSFIKLTEKKNFSTDLSLLTIFEDSTLSGRELYAIFITLNMLSLTLNTVSRAKRRTLIGYEPQIVRTLRLSLILSIVGILLPLVFLVTPPSSIMSEPLSQWSVFVIEVFLLLGTAFAFVPLVELPLRQLNDGSVEEISFVSRRILSMIDRKQSDSDSKSKTEYRMPSTRAVQDSITDQES